MVAVAKQIPEQPTPELIEEIAPAIPHLVETATTWQDFLSHDDVTQTCIGLSRFYQSQGLSSLAELWHERWILAVD